MTALRRAAVALVLLASMAGGPASAQAGPPGEAKAEGFAAEGVWMYEPKTGETVDLTIAVDKPMYLFFKGFLVVTEVQRSAELDLLFASNMVEIRARNRKRGEATLAVKGGDGRLITVQVKLADPKSGPPSPEIVAIR
jgi:hypothetical protein